MMCKAPYTAGGSAAAPAQAAETEVVVALGSNQVWKVFLSDIAHLPPSDIHKARAETHWLNGLAPCGPNAPWRRISCHSHVHAVAPLTSKPAVARPQGDRARLLLDALRQLPAAGVRVVRSSLLYESAPMHVVDQPRFLNAAALCATALPPLELLDALKGIEAAAGRDFNGQRYGRPLACQCLAEVHTCLARK